MQNCAMERHSYNGTNFFVDVFHGYIDPLIWFGSGLGVIVFAWLGMAALFICLVFLIFLRSEPLRYRVLFVLWMASFYFAFWAMNQLWS